MKTIGLIGGMSWESTVTYYRIINETVKKELGGLHSAKLALYSVDFQEIEKCQAEDSWEKSALILSGAARSLERAGAELLVICTNTMHKVAPEIQSIVSIPLLHIADATALELNKAGIKKAALLGTKYTMTQDFYKGRLKNAGIETVTPEGEDAELVNRVIYEELCLGVISEASRRRYVEIIGRLADNGAAGVILGCTEIGLLIGSQDTALPVFDTTRIHAEKAARLALED